jgi:hypothetical protein
MATLTLRPNGAGNQQNWNAEGGDYTRVDESSSDGDTTRLYSPTDNAVATFALDDPTTQEGVINSVTVYIYTRGLDPVSNTVQLAVRIASTDYFSSTQTYNNTSYHNESNVWTTNPNTGVAWTWADIIALEAGMKRIGGGGQAVTQVWVEVDYTPATWEQEGFRFRNDDGYEASAVAAIRGSSKADATTGTAVSVARPTGVVEGDLVVCIVHGNGQITIADNNGGTPFTKAANFSDYKPNTSNGHTVTIFYRTIQSGDPSTYDFTLSASGRWAVDCIGFIGPCAFDVAPNTANAANEDDTDDGTISSPSITTLVNNAIHVNFCAWDTSATGTITTPSGYTLLQNANSGGNPLHTSYKLITAAGATGAVSNVNTEFAAMIAGSFSVYNTNLGATWLANQDTNVTSAKSATKRLRLLLNSTGAADPRKFILYFKKSTDGTYIKVPTSGTSEAFTIVSSSFIAASGEATTAQLTAPSGKSTSDFDAGCIQDDENPADSVTVSADDYTEMEWTLQANSAAVDGAVYQFRVYKYLETFTSELTTGGTPSALGDNQPSEGADEAFDDAAGTKWLHFSGSATWLKYDLGSGVAKKVIKYALTSANDDDTRDPKNWKLQGSNDNSTWTDIDTRTGETFASRQLRKEYTCNSPSDTAFRYWKLDISLNNGNGSITQLAEVQLYAYNDPIALDTYTLTPEWTIPSGTTDVGVSDTGSGSDAISVLALVGQADTGSGADAISLVALVPQTDSGSGVDTISILALLPVTDSGTGVDEISLLALISQSDTGSGSDAISLMALVSQSDTGEGVDTISLIGLIPVTDTGSGVETLSLLALVPQTDSVSGLDSIDLLAMVPVTDSGSGSEEVSSFPSVSQSDTGSGVDSISLLGMIPVTDNGVGVDTIEITGFIYVSDTGSGSDSVAAIIFPTVTDSGSGVDEVSILGLIPVTDAGSGVDSLAITSYVDITDSGSGAEILEILNQVSVTDSLTATDAVSILALISQTDAGTGNEELQLLLQAAIDDVGNGVDTITVFRLFTEHRTVVLATGNVVARLKSGVKGVKLESGSIVIKL